jgi:hypothetical protein
VGASVLNLLPLVAGAHSDDGRTASYTGTDPTWRVLEHDAVICRETEFLGSEEEWVWSGFASLETLVVCSNGYFRRDNAHTSHATICCDNDQHHTSS